MKTKPRIEGYDFYCGECEAFIEIPVTVNDGCTTMMFPEVCDKCNEAIDWE